MVKRLRRNVEFGQTPGGLKARTTAEIHARDETLADPMRRRGLKARTAAGKHARDETPGFRQSGNNLEKRGEQIASVDGQISLGTSRAAEGPPCKKAPDFGYHRQSARAGRKHGAAKGVCCLRNTSGVLPGLALRDAIALKNFCGGDVGACSECCQLAGNGGKNKVLDLEFTDK